MLGVYARDDFYKMQPDVECIDPKGTLPDAHTNKTRSIIKIIDVVEIVVSHPVVLAIQFFDELFHI